MRFAASVLVFIIVLTTLFVIGFVVKDIDPAIAKFLTNTHLYSTEIISKIAALIVSWYIASDINKQFYPSIRNLIFSLYLAAVAASLTMASIFAKLYFYKPTYIDLKTNNAIEIVTVFFVITASWALAAEIRDQISGKGDQ